MGFRLAPSASYCCAEAQRVFLDTERDRYFCLREAQERAFATWEAGQALEPGDLEILAGLAAQGVLAEQPGPDILPSACPAIDCPEASLFDQAGHAGGTRSTIAAHARFRWLQCRLGLFGLAANLASLERHKRRGHARDDALDTAKRVAQAFRGAARFATTRHHCLPHSLAVAHALAAHSVPGLLVIGVRMRPFGAHAWVQLDGLVVNDSVDNVREFTPIRLV